MSLIGNIQELVGLATARLGTSIRVRRFSYVSESGNPQDAYNAQTGRTLAQTEGLYTTKAMAPAPDVGPAMGDLQIVEGTVTMPTGASDSGAYFDVKRNDVIEFLDGSLAGTFVIVDHADFVSAGGGRRASYQAGSGAIGSIGAGTDTD